MFSFSKPLALFPYKEFMLTKSEIRLLEYAESLDDIRKKLADEKRHERLVLEQSLQMSSLSGIQLQMETKKEPKELAIPSSSTVTKDIPITSDDFSKLQGGSSSSSSSSTSISHDLQENSSSSSSSVILKVPKDTPAKTATSSSSTTSSSIHSNKAIISSSSTTDNEMMQVDNIMSQSIIKSSKDILLPISQSSVPSSSSSSGEGVVDQIGIGTGASLGISRIKKKQKISATDSMDISSATSISNAMNSSISDRLPFNLQRDGFDSIFTPEGLLSHFDWSPSETNITPISFKLTNFKTHRNMTSTEDDNIIDADTTGGGVSGGCSITGNQTLALKMTVTPSKGRWSINFCPDDPKDFADILLHFNPRYSHGNKSESLVMNDLQGTWGKPIKKSLNNNMRTSSLNLIIQIRLDGFYIFANGIFASYFAHRRNPMTFDYNAFTLQFPATDSMGNLESLTLHKVWWGRIEENVFVTPNSKLLIPEEMKITGSNNYYQNLWIRTVCVDGLPPESDPTEIYELEKALYQLFAEYIPETVYIVDGKGRAYVRLKDEISVEPAIQELNNSVLADTFTLVMSPTPFT